MGNFNRAQSHVRSAVSTILKERPPEVWELYHEHSKLRRGDREFLIRIGGFFGNPSLQALTGRVFKVYATAPKVRLDGIADDESHLERLIRSRRSAQAWSQTAVPLPAVARLLKGASGITGVGTSTSISQFFRAAPSGGALYPIETYAALFRVDGAMEGLYHYDARENVLEQLDRESGLRARLAGATAYPGVVGRSAFLIMLTAIFERTTLKYGDRGYRFALLEAGHIAQNVCLMAEELGLGALCVGGFYDREVEALVGIDGIDESVIYMVAVGYKAGTGE